MTGAAQVWRLLTGDHRAVSDRTRTMAPIPDGLTILDAAGQWRDATGSFVRERTKLVLILAEPGAAGMRRTEEIAQAYERAFGQEAVLRAITTACVSF